jgi:UPF0042 nucleotide-binding protein
MRLIIVTGLSGAGKSTALRALEDVEYYPADNVPLPLLVPFAETLERVAIKRAAVVVDSRQEPFLHDYRPEVERLREAGHRVEVLFLDADDEVLLRRFSETRRRHPLAGDDLPSGIRRDRDVLAELREDAVNAIVDTGNLNVHQLKGIIQERYGRKDGALAVTLLSFGFKHGLPAECDVVVDVRFLPNPYFVEELSGRTGMDPEVAAFVLDTEAGRKMLEQTEQFLRFTLPQHEREGKLYLTIGIGCTGGRHRSVAMVEELGRRLGDDWHAVVRHRDLGRSEGGGR